VVSFLLAFRKFWHATSRLHGVTSQKNVMFINHSNIVIFSSWDHSLRTYFDTSLTDLRVIYGGSEVRDCAAVSRCSAHHVPVISLYGVQTQPSSLSILCHKSTVQHKTKMQQRSNLCYVYRKQLKYLKPTIFYYVIPCSLVEVRLLFGWMFRIHLQGLKLT
jgi:hypothetical protein